MLSQVFDSFCDKKDYDCVNDLWLKIEKGSRPFFSTLLSELEKDNIIKFTRVGDIKKISLVSLVRLRNMVIQNPFFEKTEYIRKRIKDKFFTIKSNI